MRDFELKIFQKIDVFSIRRLSSPISHPSSIKPLNPNLKLQTSNPKLLKHFSIDKTHHFLNNISISIDPAMPQTLRYLKPHIRIRSIANTGSIRKWGDPIILIMYPKHGGLNFFH